MKNEKCQIIAEMSANHCGDLEVAKRVIAAAKDCGADAVKVQTYTADTLTIDCRSECFKVSGGTLWDGSYLYDLYSGAGMPWEWQKPLKDFADSLSIEFFSTPFDASSADFLESIGVPRFKIASFEAVDYPLLRHVARKGRPMIVSTGISSLGEICEAVDICLSEGCPDLTLMKCTSAYPAKLEDMNLATVSDMLSRFGPLGVKVGLSDHSMGPEPAVAAVALGCSAIEKHFTLDRSMPSADSAFSLNPAEFAALVRSVRDAEKAMGAPGYAVNEGNRRFARSLFVVCDMKAGDRFTPENIRSIRPSDGLHTRHYEAVLGGFAACDIAAGTPLSAGLVGGVKL